MNMHMLPRTEDNQSLVKHRVEPGEQDICRSSDKEGTLELGGPALGCPYQ